jgi:hypothetical protein
LTRGKTPLTMSNAPHYDGQDSLTMGNTCNHGLRNAALRSDSVQIASGELCGVHAFIAPASSSLLSSFFSIIYLQAYLYVDRDRSQDQVLQD